MPSQGINFAAAVGVFPVGASWTVGTVPNAAGPDDGVFAECVMAVEAADGLKWSGFGFALPGGAVIEGIEVLITRWAPAGDIFDESVLLNFGGGNKADLNAWSNVGAVTVTYGGIADLWGAVVTAADVNAVNFGCSMVCSTGGIAVANVDSCGMRVTFTNGSSRRMRRLQWVKRLSGKEGRRLNG